MSIWGTILGGAAGFALGGPLGALLGASVGHALGGGMAGRVSRAGREATAQITFTIAVIALSAKMAKADGQVTRDEIDAFKEVFHVPPHELRNVGRVFDMAKQDTAGYEAYAKQVADLFKDDPQVLEDLLGALCHIAKADGVVHPGEEAYLGRVAEIFGFTGQKFESIKACYLGETEASPYTVLGVDPDVPDDELKATYRRLVKEHHPDRLIARGLPEEFIEVANERLAAINDAYAKIEKMRALN